MKNLLEDIPAELPVELTEVLASNRSFRLERIVSRGHVSPPDFWYDQIENEWITILQGEAILAYSDGTSVALKQGDSLLIPAHRKHRVAWTVPDAPTIWLALFYVD